MASRIIHVEVVGKDGPALQRFYTSLFGWNLDTSNAGGYGIASRDENGVDTGIGATQDGSAGWVSFYVAVPDVNKALARATELGGRVVTPKFSPDGNAQLALFADPEGHVIGLTEV
ncbi:MAG: VOC family protein [Candidatus Limnocylindrales bacterium]